MKLVKIALLTAVGAFLSACDTADVATRNVPFESAAYSNESTVKAGLATEPVNFDFRVEKVTVEVPSSLRVSEANLYFPQADIVWRGDVAGDRHQQVKAIFETAIERGINDLNGSRRVNIDIKVIRFHALTEKARYSVGGVHNITFLLTIRDAATGEPIGEPKEVHADLKAYGGDDAIQADARGETQKVRITAHLSNVIHLELTDPRGFRNPNLGIIQAMHKGI